MLTGNLHCIINEMKQSINCIFSGVFTSDDVGKFKTLVIFDCRGVEPIDFEPKSGWIAEAENDGTVFLFFLNTLRLHF